MKNFEKIIQFCNSGNSSELKKEFQNKPQSCWMEFTKELEQRFNDLTCYAILRRVFRLLDEEET
jgi:hypothetical protein